MIALYDDTAYATTGSHPDVVVLVFCDATDVIVAESLFLCEVLEVIGLEVQNVQTFACSHPDEAS